MLNRFTYGFHMEFLHVRKSVIITDENQDGMLKNYNPANNFYNQTRWDIKGEQ